MSDNIPDVDDISIPSSVKKAHAEARIAEQEAGEYIHKDNLRGLIEKFRDGEYQRRVDYYAGVGLSHAAQELEALINDDG